MYEERSRGHLGSPGPGTMNTINMVDMLLAGQLAAGSTLVYHHFSRQRVSTRVFSWYPSVQLVLECPASSGLFS